MSTNIRETLDGLERISNCEVSVDNHHYLILSELNNWMAKKAVPFAKGKLLDYGCGARPYKNLFESTITSYTGADVAVAAGSQVDVLITPDAPLPLESGRFDTVLSSQTLEHVSDPSFYLNEANRMLRTDGHLILSAPMFWRHHEVPFDYTRFTKYGMVNLLEKTGFAIVSIEACGGLIAGIAQSILDALACKGRIYPALNRWVNPLIKKLDQKYRDEDLAICWMVLAKKTGNPQRSFWHSELNDNSIKCTLCDSTKVTKAFPWQNYEIFRCAKCNADFIYPSPSESDLNAAYDGAAYFGGDHVVGGYSDYDEQTAPVLPTFEALLDEINPNNKTGLRLLDVGCAYGTHLGIALERGLSATGIEISAHARAEASKRLDGKAIIYKNIEDLPTERFDIVILMDVIEHLTNPREVFKDLQDKGLITSETTLIITTPNVRSGAALREGVKWRYYHPPYHCTYFSAKAMRNLLRGLKFSDIDIRGIYPDARKANANNIDLETSAGILAIAKGLEL